MPISEAQKTNARKLSLVSCELTYSGKLPRQLPPIMIRVEEKKEKNMIDIKLTQF
jgi:hypothetical protein